MCIRYCARRVSKHARRHVDAVGFVVVVVDGRLLVSHVFLEPTTFAGRPLGVCAVGTRLRLYVDRRCHVRSSSRRSLGVCKVGESGRLRLDLRCHGCSCGRRSLGVCAVGTRTRLRLGHQCHVCNCCSQWPLGVCQVGTLGRLSRMTFISWTPTPNLTINLTNTHTHRLATGWVHIIWTFSYTFATTS